MTGKRSSARLAANASSSPPSAKSNGGTKRKADESSPTTKAKRGRPSKASKEQKTLEDTFPSADDANESNDTKVDDAELKVNGDDMKHEAKAANAEENHANGETKEEGRVNALDQVKADENDTGKTSKGDSEDAHNAKSENSNEAAIEEDKERKDAMPSNILEKGIIYFFTRGRVGVEDPDSVQDLARSYFVLRPLPAGAKLTDGAIQDLKNNRLVALPKKVWPKSGKDRFMAFVEKAHTTIDVLKDEFFSGSDYSTQTLGTRHTPEVTPIGEGVYALTSTGGGQGTTHLVYMLTIPTEVGEVQKDVGLAEKGSFVVSLKNPESSGPANAQLAQGAEYSKEIMEEFRGRGWMPAHPKHLDYANAQFLLIGENFDSSSNLDPTPKDEKNEAKETPQEELEKLENEDELRVEHLDGNDTVFADLGISSKEYPKVMTTW